MATAVVADSVGVVNGMVGVVVADVAVDDVVVAIAVWCFIPTGPAVIVTLSLLRADYQMLLESCWITTDCCCICTLSS